MDMQKNVICNMIAMEKRDYNARSDIEKLRKDLIDYFGSAMSFYPVAIVDLTDVENASD